MIESNVTVTHCCGHTQQHTAGSASGDHTELTAILSKEKCSHCHPMCMYCHRYGNREKMLILPGVEREYIFCNDWCRKQSENPTRYAEHNSIEIPYFLRRDDWKDTSWHNDTCGSSVLQLAGGTSTRPEMSIRFWVEHEAPAEREGYERFVVEFLVDGENPNGPQCDWLYSGDDEIQASHWARAAECCASGEPLDEAEAGYGMALKIEQLMKAWKPSPNQQWAEKKATVCDDCKQELCECQPTLLQVADILTEKGYSASFEYPGYVSVMMPNGQVACFGNCNVDYTANWEEGTMDNQAIDFFLPSTASVDELVKAIEGWIGKERLSLYAKDLLHNVERALEPCEGMHFDPSEYVPFMEAVIYGANQRILAYRANNGGVNEN